jgi:hypothetical protein
MWTVSGPLKSSREVMRFRERHRHEFLTTYGLKHTELERIFCSIGSERLLNEKVRHSRGDGIVQIRFGGASTDRSTPSLLQNGRFSLPLGCTGGLMLHLRGTPDITSTLLWNPNWRFQFPRAPSHGDLAAVETV